MRTRRMFTWAGAVLALGAVFAAYLAPGMALSLATQLCNCF